MREKFRKNAISIGINARNKYDLQWNIYDLYIKMLYLFKILSQNRIFFGKVWEYTFQILI